MLVEKASCDGYSLFLQLLVGICICPGFISPLWYPMSLKFEILVLLIVDKSAFFFI